MMATPRLSAGFFIMLNDGVLAYSETGQREAAEGAAEGVGAEAG